MSKSEPRRPIEGRARLEFTSCTKRFAEVLEDLCYDCLYRAQLYSNVDGEILMKAIISDEEGRLSGVNFQMNPKELVLRVSNKFKTLGNRSKALAKIRDAIIKYINEINEIGLPPISAVFFDIGVSFNTITYAPDPKERGSIKVYLQTYSEDEFGITEIKDAVGAELVNM